MSFKPNNLQWQCALSTGETQADGSPSKGFPSGMRPKAHTSSHRELPTRAAQEEQAWRRGCEGKPGQLWPQMRQEKWGLARRCFKGAEVSQGMGRERENCRAAVEGQRSWVKPGPQDARAQNGGRGRGWSHPGLRSSSWCRVLAVRPRTRDAPRPQAGGEGLAVTQGPWRGSTESFPAGRRSAWRPRELTYGIHAVYWRDKGCPWGEANEKSLTDGGKQFGLALW